MGGGPIHPPSPQTKFTECHFTKWCCLSHKMTIFPKLFHGFGRGEYKTDFICVCICIYICMYICMYIYIWLPRWSNGKEYKIFFYYEWKQFSFSKIYIYLYMCMVHAQSLSYVWLFCDPIDRGAWWTTVQWGHKKKVRHDSANELSPWTYISTYFFFKETHFHSLQKWNNGSLSPCFHHQLKDIT